MTMRRLRPSMRAWQTLRRCAGRSRDALSNWSGGPARAEPRCQRRAWSDPPSHSAPLPDAWMRPDTRSAAGLPKGGRNVRSSRPTLTEQPTPCPRHAWPPSKLWRRSPPDVADALPLAGNVTELAGKRYGVFAASITARAALERDRARPRLRIGQVMRLPLQPHSMWRSRRSGSRSATRTMATMSGHRNSQLVRAIEAGHLVGRRRAVPARHPTAPSRRTVGRADPAEGQDPTHDALVAVPGPSGGPGGQELKVANVVGPLVTPVRCSRQSLRAASGIVMVPGTMLARAKVRAARGRGDRCRGVWRGVSNGCLAALQASRSCDRCAWWCGGRLRPLDSGRAARLGHYGIACLLRRGDCLTERAPLSHSLQGWQGAAQGCPPAGTATAPDDGRSGPPDPTDRPAGSGCRSSRPAGPGAAAGIRPSDTNRGRGRQTGTR